MIKISDLNISIVDNSLKVILLQNANFVIKKGEIITITGKNGSGKTTFLKSLTSLNSNKKVLVSGEIIIKTINITEANNSKLRKLRAETVRYVFQDPISNFDPLKRIKYYFKHVTNEELSKNFEKFNLELNTLNLFPYEVSGGMAQRISILHAFLNSGSLICMDEPTSFLDEENRNVFYELCKGYAEKGKSIIVVTQDKDVADQISDSVYNLANKSLAKVK